MLACDGNTVQLRLNLITDRLWLSKGQIALAEPWIVNGADSAALPSIGIYGRNHYYRVNRNGKNLWQGNGDYQIRGKRLPQVIRYAGDTEYQPWMDNATVVIKYYTVDGCGDITGEHTQQGNAFLPPPLQRRTYTLVPKTIAASSPPEQRSGTAYIDFLVNSTQLNPDYHQNQRELNRIKLSLDSVRADSLARIQRFTICGYASPEGSYENNIRLASGRSETLSQYVADHFGIPRDNIVSTFVPEDWKGLREYVERKQSPNRDAILGLISTVADPDRRLALIRQRFPDDYADIAKNALPYLRHSDYLIEYVRMTADGTRLPAIDLPPDTLWTTEPAAQPDVELEYIPNPVFRPFRPWVAVKTNILFDLALTPNIELEFPFGQSRWSLMAEYWNPWYVYRHNAYAYEIQAGGLELRYWAAPCWQSRPSLTGTFAGIYAAGGKYDWEWKSQGDQGEFLSFGLTLGHSWTLCRRLNLEVSASGGYVFGPRRHYHGEFEDTHLIYQHSGRIAYIGPTKLKVSIAWLLGSKKKGGTQQ